MAKPVAYVDRVAVPSTEEQSKIVAAEKAKPIEPHEVKSGRWVDPKMNEGKGQECMVSSNAAADYRALCAAQLAKGWVPVDPFPAGEPPLTYLVEPKDHKAHRARLVK